MTRTKTKEKTSHAIQKKTGENIEIEPKKMVEADAPIILPELDEKIIDDESPAIVTEEDESEETPTIDEEDVNPFGDKWEQ